MALQPKVYQGNEKHKHPWQPGRKGSLCEREIDQAVSEQLLAESVPWPLDDDESTDRFAIWQGKAYRGHERGGVWWGYPVGWLEVPEPIRNRWKKGRQLSHRDEGRYWSNHEGDR